MKTNLIDGPYRMPGCKVGDFLKCRIRGRVKVYGISVRRLGGFAAYRANSGPSRASHAISLAAFAVAGWWQNTLTLNERSVRDRTAASSLKNLRVAPQPQVPHDASQSAISRSMKSSAGGGSAVPEDSGRADFSPDFPRISLDHEVDALVNGVGVAD